MGVFACVTALTALLPHVTGMLFRSVDERTLLMLAGMILLPLFGLRFLHRAYRDTNRLPALVGWSGYVTATTFLSVAHALEYQDLFSMLVLTFCLLLPYILGLLGMLLTGRMEQFRADKNLS